MKNKKLIKKITIGSSIATAVFLIFGLIFIGAGKIVVPILNIETGDYVATKFSGFSALNLFGLDTVLSNSLFRNFFVLPGSQLSLITCGVIFSVVFTPILFIISAFLSAYYYFNFISKTKDDQLSMTNINENQEENPIE